MTRQDYLTHLVLAVAFLAVLTPYLIHSGLSFHSELYLVGTSTQVLLASVFRILKFGSAS
jgi:hypothetical protein